MQLRQSKWLVAAVASCAIVAPGVASASMVTPGAATPGTQLWAKTFTGGSGRTASATAVAVSPSQPVAYVTGVTTRTSGTPHSHDSTLAYDSANGVRRWLATYRGLGAYHPGGPPSIAVSQDSSKVFVLDNIRGGSVIQAYSASDGSLLWASVLPPVSGRGSARFIAVSPDGSQVFIGGTTGGFVDTGYETVAVDAATGQKDWEASTPPQWAGGGATALAVSPNGSEVLETGRTGTVAYNATTGAQLWRDHYKLRWDRGGSMAVSPDSSTVYVSTPNSGGPLLIAYNAATGAQAWAVTSSGGHIAISPDGSRVLVTTSSGTTAYNASTGAQLWAASSGGQYIAVSPDGSQVVVTGVSGSGGTTISYDAATGQQLWTATNSAFTPASVAVTANGSQAVVTGSATTASGTREYLTVAYQT